MVNRKICTRPLTSSLIVNATLVIFCAEKFAHVEKRKIAETITRHINSDFEYLQVRCSKRFPGLYGELHKMSATSPVYWNGSVSDVSNISWKFVRTPTTFWVIFTSMEELVGIYLGNACTSIHNTDIDVLRSATLLEC